MLLVSFLACQSADVPAPEPLTVSAEAEEVPTPPLALPRLVSQNRITQHNLDAFQLNPPRQSAKVKKPLELRAEHTAVMTFLQGHLKAEASSIENPWALLHSILAFGNEHHTVDGKLAVKDIIETYGTLQVHGEHQLIDLPASVEVAGKSILIEPHEDLALKVFTEVGTDSNLSVTVEGVELTMRDLYLNSLLSTYLLPEQNLSSFKSTDDMPWGIQALSYNAPLKLTWISTEKQVPMSMEQLTLFGVAVLSSETGFMKEALATNTNFQRQGQGIFKYTCGGAHLLQGVAYSVARGFGNDKAVEEIKAQVNLLFYRFPIELQIYDQTLQAAPQHKRKLLVQRFKFTGHFLETVAKLEALGFYTPTAKHTQIIQGAADQLVLVTEALRQDGVFSRLGEIKKEDPQMYLDLLGDAGHAVYGLQLISGQREINF